MLAHILCFQNCKDKIRQYKSRLEREENTKKQQLKIMRKTHDVQIHEKEKLINNLQSLVEEQEDRIKELEDCKQGEFICGPYPPYLNMSSGLCGQQRPRSACTSAQSNQGLCCSL